jgi:hypothetical protein
MATPFSDIYELCMTSIRDYKIDQLFDATDLTNFENLMFGFMKKAIPKFIHCKKQLDQIMDITTNEFTEDLTLNEQVILSDLMIIRWLDTKILDVTQMQWKLNDTDFKHYAESQNLTAKMNARTILQEDVGQDMTNYELKNVSWLDWQQQNFYIY